MNDGMRIVTASWIDQGSELDSELEDGTTPRQWIDLGFPRDEAMEWIRAGCFDPKKVCRLIVLGLSPGDVARRTDEKMERRFGLGYSGYSLGYMFCNGDLDSPEQLRILVDYSD